MYISEIVNSRPINHEYTDDDLHSFESSEVMDNGLSEIVIQKTIDSDSENETNSGCVEGRPDI